MRLRPFTPQNPPTPATKPITSAPIRPTKPHAGVIATSPATAPDAAPRAEALPRASDSLISQASTAMAEATMVLRNAFAAVPVASRFDPALKPNQPTQSRQAPIMVSVRLCGGIDSFPYPIGLPMTYAPTRPATPALICTAVPPAKSSAPFCHSQPAAAVTASRLCASVIASGPSQYHTIWAIGA